MFRYDKDMERVMQAKKREVLNELENAKERILKELSGVDKITLTRLRQVLNDYNKIDYAITEKINSIEKKLYDFTASGTPTVEGVNKLNVQFNEVKITLKNDIKELENKYSEVLQEIANERTERQTTDETERTERQTAVETERTERQADVSRLTTELAVERERINNFTTLQEGSTTGDAELIDARTDYNGTTHENVGEHIRTVTGQLSNEIEELQDGVVGYNLVLDTCEKFQQWGGPSQTTFETTESSVICNKVEEGNTAGVYTPVVTKPNKNIHFVFDIEMDETILSMGVKIFLSNTVSYTEGSTVSVNKLTANGHHDFDIDTSSIDFEIKYIFFVVDKVTGVFTISNLVIGQSNLVSMGYSNNLVDAFIEHCKQIDSADGEYTHTLIEPNLTNSSVWGSGISIDERTNSSITISKSTTSGSSGFTSPKYEINPSIHLHVSFDLEMVDVTNVKLWIAEEKNFSGGNASSCYKATSNGHHEVDVDLPYYAVYNNISKPSCLWFIVEGQIGSFTISNLVIEQSLLMDFGYSPNLYDAFIEHCKGNTETDSGTIESNNDEILVSPSGNRYALQIDNSGTVTGVPIVPSKTLFIGNSLLTGFSEFGMAASDSQHDYYYLVNQAIEEQKSGHISSKLGGTGWESQTTAEGQSYWLNNTLLPHLSSDLDLVIVQLGDNVNTDAKKLVFAEGSKNLLKFIREHCPNCRVAWVGAWYQTEAKQAEMMASCKATGSTFINIWDLNTKANQSAIGNTYTMADGTANTITESGVASHPGDLGFKAIANRILYTLGIVDTENYYE